MGRTIGLPLLLVTLLIGAYLFMTQARSNGPTSAAATREEAQATAVAVGSNFQGADPVLADWFASNGTYAGATLPPAFGVTLVRADATSYCLQTTSTAIAVSHEDGPDGSPEPGPC